MEQQRGGWARAVRMDRDGFWALIQATRQEHWDRYWAGDCEAHTFAVIEALTELAPEEITTFDRILDELVWRDAYSWDLWGAAYHLNGGCSDDGFVYFRHWLVGQGRDAFEAAVRDPDSLADLPFLGDLAVRSPWDLGLECEDLMYAAREAFERVTGNGMPLVPFAGSLGGPTGESWDFEDDHEVRARLPKLWALLHSTGSGTW